MKPFLFATVGLLLLLAPLWTLFGFVTVPEYRTGGIADYRAALISGVTLYGGVFAGALIGEHFKTRLSAPVFRRVFVAGLVGAMCAITLAVIGSFLIEFVATRRI